MEWNDEVQKVSRDAKMGTLMGPFAAGQGVGAVLLGPISEMLLATPGVGSRGTRLVVDMVLSMDHWLSSLVSVLLWFGLLRS